MLRCDLIEEVRHGEWGFEAHFPQMRGGIRGLINRLVFWLIGHHECDGCCVSFCPLPSASHAGLMCGANAAQMASALLRSMLLLSPRNQLDTDGAAILQALAIFAYSPRGCSGNTECSRSCSVFI